MPTKFFPVGKQGQKKNQEKYHKLSHTTAARDQKHIWRNPFSFASVSVGESWATALPLLTGDSSSAELLLQRKGTSMIYCCREECTLSHFSSVCFIWDLSCSIQEIWPELHWNCSSETLKVYHQPSTWTDKGSLESFKESYMNATLLFLCILQIFFETRIYRAEQMHCAPKPAKNCQQLVSFNSHYAFSVTIKPCEYYAS